MKIKHIIILFIAINSNINYSQNALKAKALLDKVSAQAKAYKNIQLNFSYSLQNSKEKVNQESKGNITLQGNEYLLNFMEVTKICDGKKTYTISKEDEEITIEKTGIGQDDNDTPDKMLSFFNKGFKYSWDILQNIKGTKIQYIKLIPISSKDERKEILVGIDVKKNQIYNTISIGKNGTKVTLLITSYKTNITLPKNQFLFVSKNYPNYYINKLDK
jgi:hypothetical protein